MTTNNSVTRPDADALRVARQAWEKLLRIYCNAEYRSPLDDAHISEIADSIRALLTERERELREARNTIRELNRKNGALQHTINIGSERKAWYGYYRAAMQLFGEEEEKLKSAEQRERELREVLRAVSDDLRGFTAAFPVHAGEKSAKLVAEAERLLAR